MSDAPQYPLGAVCHIELPSTDLDASVAFYRDVFGWEIDEQTMPDYPMFNTGTIGGGFVTGATPGENAVVLVLAVEDIPAILEKIESAGGTTLTDEIEIPGDMGFYAYFKDPSGNKMGVWRGA